MRHHWLADRSPCGRTECCKAVAKVYEEQRWDERAEHALAAEFKLAVSTRQKEPVARSGPIGLAEAKTTLSMQRSAGSEDTRASLASEPLARRRQGCCKAGHRTGPCGMEMTQKWTEKGTLNLPCINFSCQFLNPRELSSSQLRQLHGTGLAKQDWSQPALQKPDTNSVE